MALIHVENLTFGYDGAYDKVFDRVSFQLDTGWRTGLIGRNGRGKTTLLRLLMGRLPAGGAISAGGPLQYFPCPVPDPSLPALNAARAACPHLERWALERELALLAVDPEILDRPFSTLSHGEGAKVQLAALFLNPGAFPLIDEPTNHLDAEGRQKVSAYLQRQPGFILVSHDRAFLDGCVDHILAINRQDIQVQRGNFSSWWENKSRADAFEQARNDRLKKEVRHLTAAARRTADWSDRAERSKIGTHAADRGFIGHKAAKMMRRSKNIAQRREEAAAEKSGLLRNIDSAEPLKLSPLVFHSRRLLRLEEAAVRYGGRPVQAGVTLTVEQGDRVALKGPNGSGKTSLLRLILGEALDHTGKAELAAGVIVSRVDQHTGHLSGSVRDYAGRLGASESLMLAILRKLDFPRAQFDKDMADFSEGQKKKVLMAGSLCQPAHLYIWDEPLNYIDVWSRMQIEQLILDFRPTLIFVEHDRAFCDRIATRAVTLSPPGSPA